MRIFDFRISKYCVYIINFEPFTLYNLPMYCTCCFYMHLNFKNVKKWFFRRQHSLFTFYGVCAHEKYFNFYIRHVTLSQKWKEYISPANISGLVIDMTNQCRDLSCIQEIYHKNEKNIYLRQIYQTSGLVIDMTNQCRDLPCIQETGRKWSFLIRLFIASPYFKIHVL